LERRADLFFCLYLAEVLESKLGFSVQERLAPEFPVRIGTIYPDIPIDKSYKIDYLALSGDGDKAVFVELKTDIRSKNTKQDDYLKASRAAGMVALLEGLREIFRATNSKRKYFCLLEHLESMGLLRIPGELKEIMARKTLQGANEAVDGIEIISRVKECVIVYVQPKQLDEEDNDNIISFEDFAEVVRRYDEPVSQRFAKSLVEWAEIPAGKR